MLCPQTSLYAGKAKMTFAKRNRHPKASAARKYPQKSCGCLNGLPHMHRRCQDKIRIPVFPENKKARPDFMRAGNGSSENQKDARPGNDPGTRFSSGVCGACCAKKHTRGRAFCKKKKKRRCRAGSRTKRTVFCKTGHRRGKARTTYGAKKGRKIPGKSGNNKCRGAMGERSQCILVIGCFFTLCGEVSGEQGARLVAEDAADNFRTVIDGEGGKVEK